MSDFHDQRTIKKTRSKHICEQCGKHIEIGSPSIVSSGRYDGFFYRYHQHIECEAAGIAYARMTNLWGEEFTWFQHDLYEPEDWCWMIEHHPIVADRLGLAERLKAQEEKP